MYAPETFDTAREAQEYLNLMLKGPHERTAAIDYPSISHTGAVGEQPKGFFSRTTYPDRIESETEYGWKAIAERLSRNVRRLDEAMQAYGFTRCDFPEPREGEPQCWHVHKDGEDLNEDEGFRTESEARRWVMERLADELT